MRDGGWGRPVCQLQFKAGTGTGTGASAAPLLSSVFCLSFLFPGAGHDWVWDGGAGGIGLPCGGADPSRPVPPMCAAANLRGGLGGGGSGHRLPGPLSDL